MGRVRVIAMTQSCLVSFILILLKMINKIIFNETIPEIKFFKNIIKEKI